MTGRDPLESVRSMGLTGRSVLGPLSAQCCTAWDDAWDVLSREGVCDDIGSTEYWNALVAWISQGSPSAVVLFILGHQETDLSGINGVDLGGPPRVDIPKETKA
jgi:hypothetical protein